MGVLKDRVNDVKAYSVLHKHLNPDGSIGIIMSKKDSRFEISNQAIVNDRIFVGNHVKIGVADIKSETLIGDGVIIFDGVKIGRWVTIRTESIIACSVHIEDYCKISPNCKIGAYSLIRAGSTIKRGTSIRGQSLAFINQLGKTVILSMPNKAL